MASISVKSLTNKASKQIAFKAAVSSFCIGIILVPVVFFYTSYYAVNSKLDTDNELLVNAIKIGDGFFLRKYFSSMVGSNLVLAVRLSGGVHEANLLMDFGEQVLLDTGWNLNIRRATGSVNISKILSVSEGRNLKINYALPIPIIFFILSIFISGGLGVILFIFLRKNLLKVCLQISEPMVALSTDISNHDWSQSRSIIKTPFYGEGTTIKEIDSLLERIKSLLTLTLSQELEVVKMESLKTLESHSRRVAHDIRSPLSALSILAKSSEELPENKRRLLISASDRISSIANDLLNFSMHNRNNDLKVEMLDQILSSIVAEKRLEFQKKELIIQSNTTYGVFARTNESKLKAIISNMINNSVEAGASTVSLNLVVNQAVILEISDNGTGIDNGILPGLLKEECISSKGDGHGVGLSTASSIIKSWGGSIKIQNSSKGRTVFEISLPKSEAPEWFVPSIKIQNYEDFVVCDDDSSIHVLFENLLSGKKITHFYSANKFDQVKNLYKKSLIFIDNEFVGEEGTGIEIIINIQNTILISGNLTSELLEEILTRKVKFIPKSSLESIFQNSKREY